MSAASSTALLLIDLQTCFCDGGGSMARQGRDISAMRMAAGRCRELAACARAAGVPVIWTRMMFAPDYSDGGILIGRLRPNLARIGALKRGDADAEFSDMVDPQPGEVVIDKARYSAQYGTSLEVVLRSGGVCRVVTAGVTTSMCVDTTVRDLGQRDYDVIVVEDACADFDEERHRAALAAMEFGFARRATSDKARRILEGGVE